MIRRILVATDGSAHAGKAVKLASDFAAKYDAELIIAHVLLTHAHSEDLKKLATRRVLGKRLWEWLGTYEAEAYSAMSAMDGSVGFITIPAPMEILEAVGRHLLDRAEAIARKAGVDRVSSELLSGDAADAILDAAKRKKADTIVLGSRGLSDFKGLLLGSVSHKVSSLSDSTCITVK